MIVSSFWILVLPIHFLYQTTHVFTPPHTCLPLLKPHSLSVNVDLLFVFFQAIGRIPFTTVAPYRVRFNTMAKAKFNLHEISKVKHMEISLQHNLQQQISTPCLKPTTHPNHKILYQKIHEYQCWLNGRSNPASSPATVGKIIIFCKDPLRGISIS